MGRGIYKRTEKAKEIARGNMKKATEAGRKLPRSLAQMEAGRKVGKLPRTQKQIETARENCRRIGKLPRTEKQLAILRTTRIYANDIICHHNDLQHGTERPDDVAYMTASEHTSLHANLRVENGTHHFLRKNR